jgi:alpha-N-arabinofuranosidase
VVFASLLMSLLRHADRVEIACLAQLVNVIAPIRSEPGSNAWRQTIFYPFAMTARHARGEVLHIQQTAPRYATAHGDATVTDVIATREPDSGDVAIFAVNRDQQESALLDIDLRAFADMAIVEHVYLGGDGLNETNSEEFPEHVNLRRGSGAQVSDHHLSISLPPVSWTMLRLSPATQ